MRKDEAYAFFVQKYISSAQPLEIPLERPLTSAEEKERFRELERIIAEIEGRRWATKN